MRAYLDIETTFSGSISVIGIYRPDWGTIQLVGGGVRDLPLYEALEGVQTVVTFNGSTFDLPVIRRRLYADLKRDFEHCDLLYVCRRKGLPGDKGALRTLLEYNREDVVNLAALECHLGLAEPAQPCATVRHVFA